jgi:hypothetical protein
VGEAAKAKRAATESSAEVNAVPHRYGRFDTLKIPPTPRELTDLLRQVGIPFPLNPLKGRPLGLSDCFERMEKESGF